MTPLLLDDLVGMTDPTPRPTYPIQFPMTPLTMTGPVKYYIVLHSYYLILLHYRTFTVHLHTHIQAH